MNEFMSSNAPSPRRMSANRKSGPRGLGFQRPTGVPPDPEDLDSFGTASKDKVERGDLSFTWSAETQLEFNLIGYTLQSWLRKNAEYWLVQAEGRSALIHYGECKEDNVIMQGYAAFVLDGQICGYEADRHNDTHRILSNKPINGIVNKLNKLLREDNPARKHYLQFFNSCTFDFHVRPHPAVSIDEVILNPEILDDILDNTIGHLEHIEGANGIIFHGQPGTGKSLAAQAIAAEALRRDYCACYVAGRINYEVLDAFVRDYLTPGLLILEDIDTFSESRSDRQQYGFSDFLMFISGLYERRQKTVVIATTNHLEYLDNAVASRPVRFNRRYEFSLPGEVELTRMFKRFFPEIAIDEAMIKTCHRYNFAGSHIAEVQRTSQILQAKHGRPAGEFVGQAIEIVRKTFHTESRSAGF
jgi:hypothetical protein